MHFSLVLGSGGGGKNDHIAHHFAMLASHFLNVGGVEGEIWLYGRCGEWRVVAEL